MELSQRNYCISCIHSQIQLSSHQIKGMKTKRQSQLGEMIRRSFSTVLQNEGPYIYGNDKLVTVTGVDVTPDLAIAKVYLSIFNTAEKDAVLIQMQKSTSFLRGKLSSRIGKKIRRMPELHFYIDETIDEMYRVNDLLNNLSNKQKSTDSLNED